MLLAGAGGLAQENAPPGFLRGGLVSWTGTPRNGQFTFQVLTGQAYLCSFDEKTYIERENRRITMAGTEKGDRIEIISDQRPGSALCYARAIQILEDPALHGAPGLGRAGAVDAAAASFWSRPNLALSGAVSRITSDLLILRSRSGEHKTVRLRPDTRFLCEGQITESGTLRVNTVVFIRAAWNLYNELEAFQVIWGGILQPAQ